MNETQIPLDLHDQEWQVLAHAKKLKQDHNNVGNLYIKRSWRKEDQFVLALRIYVCVEVDWYYAPIYFTRETADNVVRLSKGEITGWLDCLK